MPEVKPSRIVWLWLAPSLGLLVFVVDRLTKYYFFAHPSVQLNIIPRWLWLQFHLNEQMALSLPLFPIVYYSLTIAVCAVLVVQFIRTLRQRQLFEYSLIVFILVGAVSNLFDRFYYGGVIDFITIRLGSVFNIADIAIVCAIGLWIIQLFYHDRHQKIPATR